MVSFGGVGKHQRQVWVDPSYWLVDLRSFLVNMGGGRRVRMVDYADVDGL